VKIKQNYRQLYCICTEKFLTLSLICRFIFRKKTDVIIARNTIQTSVQLKPMVKNTVTMRSQKLKQKMSETVIDTSRISRMLLFVLIPKTLYVCRVLTLFSSDANCPLTALLTTVRIVLYGVKADVAMI